MKLSTKSNLEGGADIFIGVFVAGLYTGVLKFLIYWVVNLQPLLAIPFFAAVGLGILYVIPWCTNMIVDGWYSILLARKQREDFL